MNYYTYWTIADTPSQTINAENIFLIVGLSSLILSLYFFKFKSRIVVEGSAIIKWTSLCFGILLIVFYIFTLTSKTANVRSAIQVMEDRKLLSTVEGKIKMFNIEYQNTRAGQRTVESFIVGTVHFKYDDYPASGFNNYNKTHKNGGTIKNGDQIRITYITENNRIVKVELTN